MQVTQSSHVGQSLLNAIDIVLKDPGFDSKRTRQQIQEFIDRLNLLDLEPIIFRVTNVEVGEGWSIEKADEIAAMYSQFLFLNYLYYGDRSIVPTKDVDKMWHAHILDTSKYREDCDFLFGFFLEHFPYMGLRGREDKASLERSFESTVEMYQDYFSIDAYALRTCGSTGCGPSPESDFSRPVPIR